MEWQCSKNCRSLLTKQAATVLTCIETANKRMQPTLYCLSKGSSRASRSSMPSVMYLSLVAAEDLSSNRMLYPT